MTANARIEAIINALANFFILIAISLPLFSGIKKSINLLPETVFQKVTHSPVAILDLVNSMIITSPIWLFFCLSL
jgi:hypothetical protein